ncbi:MAG: glycosyltransferase [Chitinophagaceae bacterium]
MKNVFILRSNAVNPDPRVEKIATLLQPNYSVTILAWDREKESNKNELLFNQIPIIKFGPKSKFGTGYKGIIALFIWQISLLVKLLKFQNKIDIIHACDMDTVIPAFFLKTFFKKKVIYDMFDHYAYSRKFPSTINRIICKLEDYFAYNANGLILVDDIRISQIKKLNLNTKIIYNSPQRITFEKEITKKPNTISYVGILQPHRYIIEMIDNITILKNWHLNIAGFGILEDEIKNKIAKIGLSNVNFIGRVDYKSGLLQSHKAEVIVAIYDPSIPNHKYASPNKYFEALMLEKIVIAAKGTHIDKEILSEQVGFVFEYGNSNDFLEVLKKIERLTNEEKLEISGRAKNLYLKKYSYEQLGNSLNELYNSI